MMKLHFCTVVLALFFTLSVFSQSKNHDFSAVDSQAISIKYQRETLEDFTSKLTTGLNSDLEKTRAIFVWITHNVKYDCRKKRLGQISSGFTFSTEEERVQKLIAWENRQAKRTLRIKKGICGDYALLFKKMCDAAGVSSQVVTGYAKNEKEQIRKKSREPNHAWNAIQVNGEWCLVDATWESGYSIDNCRKFRQEFKDRYFLANPKQLIFSHFPEDEKWQLLDSIFSKKQFANAAQIAYGFHVYDVKNFYPIEGRLKVKKGSVKFEIELEQAEKIEEFRILEGDHWSDRFKLRQFENRFEFECPVEKESKFLSLYVVGEKEASCILTYKLR